MAFVKTWDETFPSDTQLASLGADDIRSLTTAVRERLAVDHYNLAVEAADPKIGFHNKVTLADQTIDLLGAAGATRVYSKTVGGFIELFVVLSDNTVIQITHNGKLWIEALKIAAETNKDMIRFNGTKWDRMSWASFLVALNTELKVIDGTALTGLTMSQITDAPLVKVATSSFAAQSSVSITGLLPGKKYKAVVNLMPNTAEGNIGVQFNADGGANYRWGNYGGGTYTGQTSIVIGLTVTHANPFLAELLFETVQGNDQQVQVVSNSTYWQSGIAIGLQLCGGLYSGGAALSSFQLVSAAGTMTGSIDIYELK